MTMTLSNSKVICTYCGEQQSNTNESMLAHILDCEKRPELGLLVKIHVIEDAGDNLLRTIHAVVKALAEIEGMRSKSWEIYHLSRETWEEAKQSIVEDLAAETRKALEKNDAK